jgi:hypothetical protein
MFLIPTEAHREVAAVGADTKFRNRTRLRSGKELMMNARGIARLGVLAVGLGIGAAVASTPGVASADSSTDWLSSFDSLLGGGALPALVPSTLDYQISIDGYDLFPTAGNSATAVSGSGDIAIAFGSGAYATADGGFGDYALADSTGSLGATAVAGDPASGATGNNFDFASATGDGSFVEAGNDTINFNYSDTTGSSFDSASANGGTGAADAYAGFNGSGDSSSALGNGADAISGDNGSSDSASAVGQGVLAEAGHGSAATPANYDSADVLGNLNAPTTNLTEAVAGSTSLGLSGSSDNAFVIDPLGTVGSTAIAGFGNNLDLAGVLGDDLHALAISASNMVDLLPSL